MTQRLIEVRFIKPDPERKKRPGQVAAVTRPEAALLEARAVAVRVRPAHAKQKPITNRHTVTKGE